MHIGQMKPTGAALFALRLSSQCCVKATMVLVGGSSAGAHYNLGRTGTRQWTCALEPNLEPRHTCARQAPAAQALRPRARAARCARYGARRLHHGGAADAGRAQLAHGRERLARAPVGCAALQAGALCICAMTCQWGLHALAARCQLPTCNAWTFRGHMFRGIMYHTKAGNRQMHYTL